MTRIPAAPSPNNAPHCKGLVNHAKRFAQALGWLSPITSLESKGGKEFGRSIESSLTDLIQRRGLVRLQLRRHDAAIVMSVAHYEEMLQMKTLYIDLIDRVKEMEIAAEADEYEVLYQRITSAQSREAADALFAATPDSLRETYQPGKTETP